MGICLLVGYFPRNDGEKRQNFTDTVILLLFPKRHFYTCAYLYMAVFLDIPVGLENWKCSFPY